jgi:hypothetical protein
MPDTREPRSVIEAAEQAAAAGDYPSAERLLREAAELQEAALGPLHADVANTLNNLAVVCEITGKPDDAERCFRRAYEIAIAVLEPDHPFVATSRKNLEDFCAARGIPLDVPIPPPPRPALPPPSALPPPPAVDVRVYADPPKSTDVLPKPPLVQEARPLEAARSARSLRMGALLAAGLFVTLLAATVWFRSKDDPESSKPIESQPTEPKPVEKPIAPKPTDAPKAIAPTRTDQRPTARPTTAPVPKSTLVVVEAQLCRDVRSGAPGASGWRCDAATSPVPQGRLLFYTRVKSPAATTLEHRWYRGDRLRQRVELTIRANPGSGYRTYSRNTVFESGGWRVELRTRDGVLLHEERFTVR